MQQVTILESELELVKARLVELKDAKQNLEAHPNKTGLEIESIQQLQLEITKEQNELCALREQLNQLKHTVKYELENKAALIKQKCDAIDDTVAKLKCDLESMKQAKQKLASNVAGTEEQANMTLLDNKMMELQEKINEMEWQSKEAKKELSSITSCSS